MFVHKTNCKPFNYKLIKRQFKTQHIYLKSKIFRYYTTLYIFFHTKKSIYNGCMYIWYVLRFLVAADLKHQRTTSFRLVVWLGLKHKSVSLSNAALHYRQMGLNNEISCFCLGHWVFTDSHDRHSSPKRDYSVGMFFANQQLKNLSYFLQKKKNPIV